MELIMFEGFVQCNSVVRIFVALLHNIVVLMTYREDMKIVYLKKAFEVTFMMSHTFFRRRPDMYLIYC